LNSFTVGNVSNSEELMQIFQMRPFGEKGYIFNIEELASIFHFPHKTVETPSIVWAGSKKGEPPANLPTLDTSTADNLTIFGKTNFRHHNRQFGLKMKDRRLHSYVIGKTGTGKSNILQTMIIDDIKQGRGVAVVDPHGDLVKHVFDFIPEERIKDVVYFNPADQDFSIGFNLLENVSADLKNIVASGLMSVFTKIWAGVWSARMEYILRNSILALLEYPNATFLSVMKLLSDKNYRKKVLEHVTDTVIKDYFVNEYEKYDPKFRTEAIAPIQNKVGQFLASTTVRNIVGQEKSTINMSEIMDSGKILLIDLTTGKIGEDNSALLGAMMITKIQLAAMGRADRPEEERRDFYLYVDEFQNFATESFAVILSEARKYHLNLVLANQYIAQMIPTVSDAIFGNIGTMISFRVGATDASALVKEYEPIFDGNDLINLPNYNIYIKMAIDGVTCPAFSAETLPPRKDICGFKDEVIEYSRRTYGKPRDLVEEEIRLIMEDGAASSVLSIKKDPIGDDGIKKELTENVEIIVDKDNQNWYLASLVNKVEVGGEEAKHEAEIRVGENGHLITIDEAHHAALKNFTKQEKNGNEIPEELLVNKSETQEDLGNGGNGQNYPITPLDEVVEIEEGKTVNIN
jgi:hypothetical protein